MANGRIFFIIVYVEVSGIVARFQVGAGLRFLLRSSRETVRTIQPPDQQMYESLGLDIKGQVFKFYRLPRCTIEDKKEHHLIQHKIFCLCNGVWLISCGLRNERLCIILDGQASQYSKECIKILCVLKGIGSK